MKFQTLKSISNKVLIVVGAVASPLFLYAADGDNDAVLQPIRDFIGRLGLLIINPVIYFMFAVALLVFMWGVFQYIKDWESADAKKNGQQHMMWGIIGFVIMLAVYTIIRIVGNTVGYDGDLPT
jgi:hypothetical protein